MLLIQVRTETWETMANEGFTQYSPKLLLETSPSDCFYVISRILQKVAVDVVLLLQPTEEKNEYEFSHITKIFITIVSPIKCSFSVTSSGCEQLQTEFELCEYFLFFKQTTVKTTSTSIYLK